MTQVHIPASVPKVILGETILLPVDVVVRVRPVLFRAELVGESEDGKLIMRFNIPLLIELSIEHGHLARNVLCFDLARLTLRSRPVVPGVHGTAMPARFLALQRRRILRIVNAVSARVIKDYMNGEVTSAPVLQILKRALRK